MPVLSLRLTGDQVRRLRQRAAARGVEVEAYVAILAERDLADAEWATALHDAAALLGGRPRADPPPSREAFYDED